MNRFIIAKNIIGVHREVVISKESFEAAKKSFTVLDEFVLLEERFDAVASNFLEFEKEMMAKTLDFNYAGFKDGLHQMSVRRHLNRLMMNTMSAARGFIDHFPQTCNRIFGKGDERGAECAALLSKGYDDLLGYRIFEKLRNHSQHFGFPIQSISYDTHMEGERPPYMCARHSISPIIDTEVLKRNRDFNKNVLSEMEALGQHIDLKPFLREYIAGIARAHYYFRTIAKPITEASGKLLDDLSKQYRTEVLESQREPAPLHVIAIHEDKWIECIPLDTGLREYGLYLAANNVGFGQFGISFIATVGGGNAYSE